MRASKIYSKDTKGVDGEIFGRDKDPLAFYVIRHTVDVFPGIGQILFLS